MTTLLSSVISVPPRPASTVASSIHREDAPCYIAAVGVYMIRAAIVQAWRLVSANSLIYYHYACGLSMRYFLLYKQKLFFVDQRKRNQRRK